MSTAIDPRLKFLQRENEHTLTELEATHRFGLAPRRRLSPRVRVLLQFTGDSLESFEDLGFRPSALTGDVATGTVPLDQIDALASLPELVRIESSRPLAPELDVSVPAIGADAVHRGPGGLRGAGVIIGIIDSGIDYRHENFRGPGGGTRILSIWDQALAPGGSERSPEPYGYGVEYSRPEIDKALDSEEPGHWVRHGHDPKFLPIVNRARLQHGTHVAGIAAGDGSSSGGTSSSTRDPAFTYVGVAPEADIVFVANQVGTDAFGDSAQTLDAVDYVFRLADELGRPAVVNISQGDNLGPHDGSSLLERGLDQLLVEPGRSIVKSSGNAAGRGQHASGQISPGGRAEVHFLVPAQDRTPDTIDIWYSAGDRFSLRLEPPRGRKSEIVKPGETLELEVGGNRVFVDSVLGAPENGDNRIYLQLSPGAALTLAQGRWSFTLFADSVVDGRFHAWIERGGLSPQFLGDFRTDDGTVTVPGTARDVITVGSWISKGAGEGDLSSFSSRGPTRDGRLKPEITAPGQWIHSVLPSGSANAYAASAGTSLAAPHVAGAIALLLQRDPSLTQGQIRQLLAQAARSDSATGPVPNDAWGAGKLDIEAAAEAMTATPCGGDS